MSNDPVFTDGDLTSPDGTYTLTRTQARTTMSTIAAAFTPTEFLEKDHGDQISICGAALAAVQKMDVYSGYLIFAADVESFGYDVAHAMAHFMAQYFKTGIELS